MTSKLKNRIPWREGALVAHAGKRIVVKDFEKRLAVRHLLPEMENVVLAYRAVKSWVLETRRNWQPD